MEKRVILAFVLSFVVLYAFRALYSPPPPAEPPASVQLPVPTPPEGNNTVPAEVAVKGKQASQSAAERPEEIKAESREELQFETPLYIATVSNVGGVLKSFKLKQYLDGEGHPVELINQESGEKVGWPLDLISGDKAIDEQLRIAQFQPLREPNKLVLEFASNGLHARKVLQFDPEKYLFSLETSLSKDQKEIPYMVVWQAGFGDQ